ncbi:unnamed protein product [Schistosoma turkestanicum]|nr:unnamed protein product [Schistosoma turkestanicum]
MKKSMIDDPYTPYRNATFDCQLSRYLTEGPPPVAPEPATSSTKKSDPIRSTDGLRIDKGYQVHLHRQPITNQGIIAYNGTVSCPIDNCCANSKQYPLNAYIQCNCSCHRIIKHQPIETIVFIGHANVLRYWLCKLLQLPTEGWLRLSLGHGSISTLMITNDQFTSRHDPYTQQDKEGEGEGDNVDVSDAEDAELKYGSTVTLYRFGDVGHLPRELLTQ